MKAKTIFAVAAVVLMALLLVFQQQAVRRLRTENRDLREQAAQAAGLRAEIERLARLELDAAELARLRAEHLELLRLRGEVGRLRASARAPATEPARSKPATADDAGPRRMLVPPTTATLKEGQTLVAGDWVTPDGRRGVLLATPQIVSGAGGAAQVAVAFKVLLGADAALADAGLIHTGAEGATTVLKTDQTTALLRRLTESGAVDMLAAPRVTALDGQQVRISDGGPGGVATSFDVLPKIVPGANGAEVEMTLTAQQEPAAQPGAGPTMLPLPPFAAPAADGQLQSMDPPPGFQPPEGQ